MGAQAEARRPKDEWAEAAENWRSWADEATGRGFGGAPSGNDPVSARDRDLFAADREVEPPRPATGTADGAAAPVVDEPGAGDDAGSDDPVDVFPTGPDGAGGRRTCSPSPARWRRPRGGEGTMDPMDTHEMTDDEREAAEIRRMREQARRGDGA